MLKRLRLRHKTGRIVLCIYSASILLIAFQNCSQGFKAENSSTEDSSTFNADSCVFNGKEIASGSSVTAYLTSSVSAGGTCVSEKRSCFKGQLSGSYTFASCAVGAPAACLFNGITIPHQGTVPAYQNSSVAYGQNCVSEIRVCDNGKLSGTYLFPGCGVGAPASCLFNGQAIAHGASRIAYLSSSAPFGLNCASEVRTCNNGFLSGSYAFGSCTVGQASSCLFDGRTIPSGGQVTAYATSTVPFGQMCTSQTRSCSNGVLSGNYAFGSCMPGAPASCLFNGQTVPHGSSVAAFKSAAGTVSEACQSEQRTCNNGILSGSFSFVSCSDYFEPLTVTASSHLVVMEYTVWFGFPGQGVGIFMGYPAPAPYYPTLRSSGDWAISQNGYHSGDPQILEAHLRKMEKMGIDAVLVDITNGVEDMFAEDKMNAFFDGNHTPSGYSGYSGLQSYAKNTVNLYKKWNDLKSRVKIIPFIGAQCDSPAPETCSNFFKKNGQGRSAQHRAFDFVVRLQSLYPNLSVIYKGRPLMVTFHSPVTPDNAAAEDRRMAAEDRYRQPDGNLGPYYRDLLTHQVMGAVVQQRYGTPASAEYPPLRNSGNGGVWTYFDRWNPAHDMWPSFAKSADGNRVEAFTATMASIIATDLDQLEILAQTEKAQKSCNQHYPIGAWGMWRDGANGCGPILSSTVTPRHNGATFRENMRWARKLLPTFLFIARYNEFSWGSDDGWDEETTTDIEATTLFGTKYEDIVAAEVKKFRETVSGTRPGSSIVNPTFEIKGIIDSVSNTRIFGWACTHGFEKSIDVHIYAGGPAGAPEAEFVGSAKTGGSLEGPVSSICGTEHAGHRFDFALSQAAAAQFRGKPIYVHGITPHGLGKPNNTISNSGSFQIP